jgi:hypothetical protein
MNYVYDGIISLDVQQDQCMFAYPTILYLYDPLKVIKLNLLHMPLCHLSWHSPLISLQYHQAAQPLLSKPAQQTTTSPSIGINFPPIDMSKMASTLASTHRL